MPSCVILRVLESYIHHEGIKGATETPYSSVTTRVLGTLPHTFQDSSYMGISCWLSLHMLDPTVWGAWIETLIRPLPCLSSILVSYDIVLDILTNYFSSCTLAVVNCMPQFPSSSQF